MKDTTKVVLAGSAIAAGLAAVAARNSLRVSDLAHDFMTWLLETDNRQAMEILAPYRNRYVNARTLMQELSHKQKRQLLKYFDEDRQAKSAS